MTTSTAWERKSSSESKSKNCSTRNTVNGCSLLFDLDLDDREEREKEWEKEKREKMRELQKREGERMKKGTDKVKER